MSTLYPYSSGGVMPSADMNTGSTPASRHIEYIDMLPKWARIDATLMGSDGVKANATEFIPMNEYDKRHPDQYWAYINRANFVNYALRTVSALEGIIYRKDPTVKVPKQYEKRLENINNQGDDFYSFSKKAVNGLIRHGRIGVLVDYAGADQDLDDPLQSYPYLSLYSSHNIVNWRPKNIGGTKVIDQVTLMEHYDEFLEFGSRRRVRYKVLDLENGRYRARTFERRESGEFGLTEQVYPGKRSNDGKGMTKIPFVFINPVDTSPDMHRPPILDLVDLNLSHFRTSADYENALHVLSQPTAVITGLPQEDTSTFQVGGPQVWRLPEGASAAYLEMKADGIAGTERAMADKVEAMREIGAQMLSSTADGPETAAAARIRQHSQTSVLSSIAGTCSSGLEAALQIALDWDRIEGECSVELNQDYTDSIMPPQMLSELTRTVDSGYMTLKDYVWNLQRGELLQPGRSVDEVVAEMENQPPVRLVTANPFLTASKASKQQGRQPQDQQREKTVTIQPGRQPGRNEEKGPSGNRPPQRPDGNR